MPRSHSPAAYPAAYWRLIESFSKSELPIHVQCETASEAVNRRNEWHSFIRALERSKDTRNLDLARIARGRICATGGADGSLLIWKSRDTGTFIETLEEALDDYTELVGDEATAIAYDPSTLERLEKESTSGTELQSLIDDFVGTEQENELAEDLFDDFLEESTEAMQAVKESAEPFSQFLTQPLRPIKLNKVFSSEENNPEEIG